MFDKLTKILATPICDNCLGRQFAKLLTGFGNEERGKVLRNYAAFAIDHGSMDPTTVNLINFQEFVFREKPGTKIPKEKFSCEICDDFFPKKGIELYIKKAMKKLKKLEFETFAVGSRPTMKMIAKEEELWNNGGIETVEPIKSEMNREVGKRLEKLLKKKAELKNPDVVILLNPTRDEVLITINSLYVFGYYQKIKRGIPQTKWPSGKYKKSVEQEVAKPLMKITKGAGHKFHGKGREDIDVLCLGWRPFVIEITEPVKRKMSLSKLKSAVNKSKYVNVKGLRFSSMTEVRNLKASPGDKEYRAIVKLDKPIEKGELKRLKGLIGTIKQRTPERVSHRRADLVRERLVKKLKTKFIDKKTFEMTVRTNAGLYIKELISGDNGRSNPSVAEILNRDAVCKQLDVTWVESK
jgi:tRNA pseudouridine synthase 10